MKTHPSPPPVAPSSASAAASTCPFHDGEPQEQAADFAHKSHESPPSPQLPAPPKLPGTWPPGPPAGLTGWRLLRLMSDDLLGALAAWQREYGDVVHLRIWPEHTVVVTDPSLVRELLITHHNALIRWERGVRVMSQLHGHSVLIAEGGAWHQKRQALQPDFLPKAVQAFAPNIVGATAQALAAWPEHDARWPIERALTSLTMDVIIRQVFSEETDDDIRVAEDAMRIASEAANAEFYWPVSWPDWAPWKRKKRRALRILKGLVDRHVQMRLATPDDAWPDDLLTRLLRLHRGNAQAWPLEAARDECMTTFLAGHETTAATLTWWAWCMASNPTMQAAAREEVTRVLSGGLPISASRQSLPYLAQTLDETLRLYPTAPTLISRRAIAPVTLGDWTFPARTLFMLPVQLMQHDARWFEAPGEFRPERFAAGAAQIPRGAHMPFGAGPRVCLGQHLALTKALLIAAMILQRFELSVPAGAQPPQPRLNVTLRPAQPLRLEIAQRRR